MKDKDHEIWFWQRAEYMLILGVSRWMSSQNPQDEIGIWFYTLKLENMQYQGGSIVELRCEMLKVGEESQSAITGLSD